MINKLQARIKKRLRRSPQSGAPGPPVAPPTDPAAAQNIPAITVSPAVLPPHSALNPVSNVPAVENLAGSSQNITVAVPGLNSGQVPQTSAPQAVGSHPAPHPTPAPQGVAPPVPSNTKQNQRHVAWTGLNVLTGALKTSLSVFGPLKSVVDDISAGIDMFERAAENNEEYKTLRTELNELFQELAGYLAGPVPPEMSSSIMNLAKGIEKEIAFVRQKENRTKSERYIEAMKDEDEILDCYRRIEAMLARLTRNANVNIWRIVDEQITRTRLDKLSPSHAAWYSSAESDVLQRDRCTPDTRLDVLEKIHAWADNSSSEKIFWLNGMAGTGKTTIAYTLCDDLDKASRLAACFFCSRQLPTCRDVNRVLPTISYQLASFSTPFLSFLSQALGQNPDIHTRKLEQQFIKLIAEPLKMARDALPGNLVVVIDALDECDNKNGVGQILGLLLSHALDLPVRFLVTSRPEPEIRDRMLRRRGERERFELHLHELDRTSVERDIRTYLRMRLEEAQLPDTDIERLAVSSGVLFIYAATAVRYISADDFLRSAERVELVLGSPGSLVSNNSEGVNALYATILHAAINNENLDEEDRRNLVLVLHTVVCAREPLTVDIMAKLLGLKNGNSVRVTLRRLQSVLSVQDTSEVITTLHESFPDYMLDATRSSLFYCDASRHNLLLAQRCFDLMSVPTPPFNICRLESSYVLDGDVPELPQQLDKFITMELFYACQYWSIHVTLSAISQVLFNQLFAFLSTRLLLWMEIMNLKQRLAMGTRDLHSVQAWCERVNPDGSNNAQELVQDALMFITSYLSNPASGSTPHIYVSALALWPEHRPISRHYLDKMTGLIKPIGMAMRMRELASLATCVVGSYTYSVAFSPDGSRIASGSDDTLVRVWDAYSGRMIQSPFVGHTGPVISVVYSPSGIHLASGSFDKTVRIWDARIGHMIGEPLRGHSGAVYSVAYSPDGARVASGSADATVRIWDAQTGHLIGGPLEGHTSTVNSVIFSEDGTRIFSASGTLVYIWDAQAGHAIGKTPREHTSRIDSLAYSSGTARIASGSINNTVHVWDAFTGRLIDKPFKGRVSGVDSIAYSRDGTYIACASKARGIRIFDTQSGTMLGEPLTGHTDTIRSIAYSPDGKRIVSGSDDKTIRIWQPTHSSTTETAAQGHTNLIFSVACSPDGQYVASASADNTVCVWDIHTGQILGHPFKGHTSAVNSVAWSPDGAHLVSGSHDETACVWDAYSGLMIANPFEGHTGSVNSVVYSSDGARVVSGSSDETIRIWDARTGQTIGKPLQGHTGAVNAVAYSYDNAHIASGSNDNSIRIWDAYTLELVYSLVGHTDAVASLAFSPDGARIASGSYDNTIRVWDTMTGQVIGNPLEGHTDAVTSVSYLPDGMFVVSGSCDHGIRIWDTRTGHMVGKPLEGHTNVVSSVTCSSGARHVVSASWDKTIRIWDVSLWVNAPRFLTGALNVRDGPVARSTSLVPLNPHDHLNSRSTQNNSLEYQWELDEAGWAVADASKLLIWVPPEVRGTLLRPPSTLLIPPQSSLGLDFSDAKLGNRWGECYLRI